ncbi:hypothetical protein UlMin_023964 [Ulmus minor]
MSNLFQCLSYKAERGILKVTKGSMVVINAKRNNGLYELKGQTHIVQGKGENSLGANEDNIELWHNRLGHMSLKGLQVLSKQGLLEENEITKLEHFESFILGKQHKLSFKLGSHSLKNILEYVHIDLWGPTKTSTRGGKVYLLSLVDDYSRKVWTYFLKHKLVTFK